MKTLLLKMNIKHGVSTKLLLETEQICFLNNVTLSIYLNITKTFTIMNIKKDQ